MEHIHVIKDKKFKDIYITVRFLLPLKSETVLQNTLLSYIMHESCEEYKTKAEVTKVLDYMYGASFSMSSNVIGKKQVMVCKSHIIHPKYLKKENTLLEDVFKLISSFIKKPLMNENGFDEKVFKEAKRNLKDALLRCEDDPSTYCMYEAMRYCGKGQSLGIGVIGNEELVHCITMEEVVNAYHCLLKEAEIDILVLGDIEEEDVMPYISKYLDFESKEDHMPCNYVLENITKEKCMIVEKDYTQSYITSLYTTNIKNDDRLFDALRVANCILGQLPTSLLFKEIREKHSLCYSIYSSLFPYDGVLGISTGIEVGNEDKTLELIHDQIYKMKSGEFEEEMLDIAKRMLINSLKATYDHPDTIFGFIYRNILIGKKDTIDDLILSLSKVTKQDVMEAMQQVELCVDYVFKGDDLYA